METELSELYAQKRDLAIKVAKLEKSKNSEQRDVDRLEGGSLAAFFYNVVGKMDEKLTKEKEEAYKAAVKYETARDELTLVESEIVRREETVKALEGCEVVYERAFEERLKAVRLANISETETVLRIEGQMFHKGVEGGTLFCGGYCAFLCHKPRLGQIDVIFFPCSR